jgi:hypothetical protein
MGGRFTVVLGALAALVLPAACGGQSIRRGDGESGASGEGNAGSGGSNGARDSGGPKGGTTSTAGSASSTGGSGARDNEPPPVMGGATGAGATSGSAGATAGGTSPGGGGTAARGGSGGSIAIGGGGGCANATRIPLLPDATGWIDSSSLCDGIGVQGSWFVFGDQYGDASCLDPGNHMPSECAVILQPDPKGTIFPNMNGFMQTAGTVERILPCPSGLTTSGCPEHDYAHMWGAGIGFDLNADPAELGGAHHVWNAEQFLANGIEFTIQGMPMPGLRVEFAMALTDAECDAASPPLPHGSTTDDLPTGAPYWGAQSRGDHIYPNSPVLAGVNQILWDEIQPPELGYYVFDPSRLISVRFHVPPNASSSMAYGFTVSNVTVLRSLPLD